MATEIKNDLEDTLYRHAAALSADIGERSTVRAENLAKAADYIRAEFEAAGLTVTEQSYDYFGHRVANLIATPPDAAWSPAHYVIGAHYDTVPGTPGADDNASGVAVLLEIARHLAADPPPIPVRLAAFTLEEAPAFMTRLQGSRVFARELARRDERVLGAIILEMVGFTSARQEYPPLLRWAGYPSEGNYIAIVGNRRSRRFSQTILRGFDRNPELPVETLTVPFNGWVLPATRLSDHASFWDRGWPAVMVTDTAFFRNPHYHSGTDSIETLDTAFMAELVKSLAFAVEELAQ